jgi:hypothetical protein
VGWGAIHHPTNAETVGQATEIRAPKHVLQRHVNLAACRQRMEKPNRAAIEHDAAQDSGRCEMALAFGARGAFDQGFLEGHRGGMP